MLSVVEGVLRLVVAHRRPGWHAAVELEMEEGVGVSVVLHYCVVYAYSS